MTLSKLWMNEGEKRLHGSIPTSRAIIAMSLLLIVGFAGGYYMNPLLSPPTVVWEEDSAWRAESISISGSTTVLPIANACAIAFMNKYAGTSITVSGGGSGRGYSEVIDGVVDIGMASRPPKQKEIDDARKKGVALWLYPIALDAVCVVVHPSVNETLKLTLQEVAEIFAGIYTKWSQVKPGLPDEEIYVVVREPGSGTRGTFEEYVMEPYGYSVTDAAHVRPSNPAVRTTIETTPYSIGYLGYGFITPNMVVVALAKEEGKPYIYPTIESIASFKYPISRYLYLVTSTRPESGSLTDRFIDFILSPEGQEIVEEQGFLKLPKYPSGG